VDDEGGVNDGSEEEEEGDRDEETVQLAVP
jgi:hypothetical protein